MQRRAGAYNDQVKRDDDRVVTLSQHLHLLDPDRSFVETSPPPRSERNTNGCFRSEAAARF